MLSRLVYMPGLASVTIGLRSDSGKDISSCNDHPALVLGDAVEVATAVYGRSC